jgi:leukotriene-A4 hydrolase
MKLIQLSIFVCVLFLTSCGVSEKEEVMDESIVTVESNVCDKVWSEDEIDYHTLSNYMDVYVSHIHLDVEISFDEKKLFGSATHTIDNPCNKEVIVFDSRSLDITSITLNDGEEATYEIGEYDELLGESITVHIKEDTKKVKINYSTTEGTRALDWLVPAQTAGKENPFMYTQGQAVLTRTWLPCQDTPGRRITYSAKVKVPNNLMAVMSASNPTVKNESGIYDFEMNQSIPTYLMAIAVGDIEFIEIDERTGVYSEPSMIEACRYEFGDMGKMVDAAEGLYGKYQWERYDVIVLPPSFPFGGMENPRLTFATPTIIAGDRSLTSLVAHELAHSWSGNLVTNSNWNDFWLNEGFTMYFERRIMEELYGKDYVDMLALLGYQDLLASISSLEPKMQMLKLKMKGINPDDAVTDIAYEKGYSFLRLIEELSGREKFDVFIKDYFTTHKFQTMTTEVFVTYLKENLLEPNSIEFNLNEWVYESGLPENCLVVVSERFNSVEAQLASFYETNNASSVTPQDWSTHEWLHFIRHFKPGTTVDQMAILDEAFHLTQSGNSEIAAIWFEKSINAGYNKIDVELEVFLIRVGRRKFLQPLYNALAATPEGKQKGLDIYVKARNNYHFVATSTIDRILGYSPS